MYRSTSALFATALLLGACGGGGATHTATPPPPPPLAVPTALLTASPASLVAGSAAMLTWSSTNATACAASGGWSGTLATAGTHSTGPVAATTHFSLTCSGAGGTSPAAVATVTVLPTTPPAPTAELTANPTTVAAGATSTLTWSSTNATSCTASGGWSGSLGTSGTQVTSGLTATTSFSLTCTGPGGTSGSSTQTVTVALPPTVTLAAAPPTVTSGAAATLTWTSSNASACTLSSGGVVLSQLTSGSQSTGALTASKTFSVSCTGFGGAQAVASVTVTIATPGTVTVAPRATGIALTQSQQFTATVPGGATPTWSVDGVAGGNATVGTINASGLYTAGSAAGLHTVTATSGSTTGTATIGVTDLPGVLTYHNDAARDGANTQEYALTTANVKAGSFGKLKSCAVDGAIYGQPLWVPNVTLGSAVHNVVFVTTQHDSVFAFDADSSSCTALWQISLVDAAHGGTTGETSVPGMLLGAGYGDIMPEVGVTGTPVIDMAGGSLYVVSKSVNAAQTTFYQRLHALDFTTGAERVPPVTIAASVAGAASGGSSVMFSARQENQRAGLALANGVVYIAWASHEDQTPYFGWMIGYTITGGALAQTAVFNAATNTGKAGIWMSGGAPAADASGNLYVVTGNGNFNVPSLDYGDSLLKLTAALSVTDYYTPSDQSNDNTADQDFGAGGAAVLANLSATSGPAHLLICGGKSGNFYVINRDMLGGYDPGSTKAVQIVNAGGGLYATGSFWNNYYYIGTENGRIRAFSLNPATSVFGTSPSSSSPSSTAYGPRGGTPSISAAGTANGIVWALDSKQYCTSQSPGCGPVVLHAYDATNLGTELWNSSANPADAAGYAVKFTVPTVANGKVYVGTRGNNIGGAFGSTSSSGELDVYALTP